MRAFLFFALFMFISEMAHSSGDVLELQIKGVINNGTLKYVSRGIKDAEKRNFSLVLVTLDTPGGVLQSTKDIVQAISASNIPVAVYVSPSGASATSAGTILTMSAHFAAMAPGTNIGAAHPVGSQGEDIKGAMNEKATNDTVAFLKAQAALRGRNVNWAEESIRKSASITSSEALDLKVIDVVADSVQALLWKITDLPLAKQKSLNLNESKVEVLAPTLGERLLIFLGDPNISYILMVLGGLGIYGELSAPGVVLPGVIGFLCLTLAFISLSTLPVNYGAVALLILGIVFLIAEAFITSFGALTLGGIVALVLGGLFLMDPSTGDLKLSLAILIPTVLSIASITLFIGWNLLKSRSSQSKFNDPILGQRARVESLNADGRSGKCLFKGELWDFTLEDASSAALHVGADLFIFAREKFVLKVRAQNS